MVLFNSSYYQQSGIILVKEKKTNISTFVICYIPNNSKFPSFIFCNNNTEYRNLTRTYFLKHVGFFFAFVNFDIRKQIHVSFYNLFQFSFSIFLSLNRIHTTNIILDAPSDALNLFSSLASYSIIQVFAQQTPP